MEGDEDYDEEAEEGDGYGDEEEGQGQDYYDENGDRVDRQEEQEE